MSAGVPARPSGTMGPTTSTPGKSPAASAFRAHRRVDQAGGNGIDRDALAGELHRQRFGQPDDAPLRRRVVRHVGSPGLGALGRDRHDATPPGREHVGQGGLHAGEGAGEVDGDDPVPSLRGDIEHGGELFDPGAGDEDLHRSELAANAVEPGCYRGPVRHVGAHRDGGRSPAAQLLGRSLGRLGIRVDQGHPETVGDEPLGHTEADPRSPTGDDRDPAHRPASTASNSR